MWGEWPGAGLGPQPPLLPAATLQPPLNLSVAPCHLLDEVQAPEHGRQPLQGGFVLRPLQGSANVLGFAGHLRAPLCWGRMQAVVGKVETNKRARTMFRETSTAHTGPRGLELADPYRTDGNRVSRSVGLMRRLLIIIINTIK